MRFNLQTQQSAIVMCPFHQSLGHRFNSIDRNLTLEAAMNHDIASSRRSEQRRQQEAQRETDVEVFNEFINNFAINIAVISNQAVDIRKIHSQMCELLNIWRRYCGGGIEDAQGARTPPMTRPLAECDEQQETLDNNGDE